MKYCSKCGNELMDEAVICPKCGCPVESAASGASTANQLLKASRQGKITTATILIVIAFALSLISCVVYYQFGHENPDFGTVSIEFGAGGSSSDESYKSEQWYQDKVKETEESNKKLTLALGLWAALSAVSLALGFLAVQKVKQGKKGLVYVYMLSSLAGPVSAFLVFPDFLVMFVCVIGLIALVPPILQMIAGGKLLQAAAIHE